MQKATSEMTTERLIEIVKSCPQLYDFNHPFYKNLRSKDKLWEEIGLELGETAERAKKKWKNVRDSYLKFLRSLYSANDTCVDGKVKTWQWSEQMEFLKPHMGLIRCDQSVSGYPSHDMSLHGDVGMMPVDPSEIKQDSLEVEIRDHAHDVNEPSTPYSRKKRKLHPMRPIKNPMDKFADGMEKKPNPANLDGTELIFLGYAKLVKRFSLGGQAVVRMKIAQIIKEQELLEYTTHQPRPMDNIPY